MDMTLPPPPPPPSSSKSPTPPPDTYPVQEAVRDRETSTQQTHYPTPLNNHHLHPKKLEERSGEAAEDGGGTVKCNMCRPLVRERTTVVPVDSSAGGGFGRYSSFPSPNGILKSIFLSLIKRTPCRSSDRTDASLAEDQWKIALAELSHKLIQATQRRDEAVLEASRLQQSVTELERKLNKLEIYCHGLRSGVEECTTGIGSPPFRPAKLANLPNEQVIDGFLASVSESRSAVRALTRSLAVQLRHLGGAKVFEKLSQLLQPYDIKISPSQSSRTVVLYLEAILSRTFFEDFESFRFEKNRAARFMNPTESCEANLQQFNSLRGLTWEEVLSKGTKHFSEDFSRFCDRKMSEIVGILGWGRAWPEQLLQAFFQASKAVWQVHLLANSVHPALPIMRVDSGVEFDSSYMDDMGADRAKQLIPSMVRIMVAPGFYVHKSVVKSKVMCRYISSTAIAIVGGVGNIITDG
ncbi:hypothetical protein SAY86_019915 [Trapa natans]|uniref:IRK-interacting protein n=1 Tax=Trapa natans TaxID=22666 RepID=A0AAN7R610_TRANT|nr:hypothetical protein SAY86_019915 [Trapa natans]